MCGICGCNQSENTNLHTNQYDHGSLPRLIKIEQELLTKNNAYAEQNRAYFKLHNIFTLNLVSSPGAGKTTILVETIKALKDLLPIAVIEGDQQTEHDADRIRATGIPALQINTGRACHLDAHNIGHAVTELKIKPDSLLVIENVGNLICPSSFDLGEAYKVVVLSVTEGDDKPLKYPDMFHAADLMLLNKIDLLPYVDFNVEQCERYAKQINPNIKIIQLSATKGGIAGWASWIKEQCLLLT